MCYRTLSTFLDKRGMLSLRQLTPIDPVRRQPIKDLFVCLARTTSRSNLRPTVLSPQALLYRSHCGRLSQAGSCFNTKTFFGHSSTTLLSLYPSRNLFKTWRSATHDVHALFQLKRLPYLASNLDDSPAIQATHGCPLEGFPPLTNPTIFIVVNSLRSEVTPCARHVSKSWLSARRCVFFLWMMAEPKNTKQSIWLWAWGELGKYDDKCEE